MLYTNYVGAVTSCYFAFTTHFYIAPTLTLCHAFCYRTRNKSKRDLFKWRLYLLSRVFIHSSSFCCYQVEAVVKDGLAVPDGLAVDWIAKNLYFVDSSAKRIFVCRLNGSHLASLITKDLSNPRSIAVDPRDG